MPEKDKKEKPLEGKILKELQTMNKILKEIRHIMDGIWNERLP